MINNKISLLREKILDEETSRYTKVGIPKKAVRIRLFLDEDGATKYTLYIDINRVQPHKRRSVTRMALKVGLVEGFLFEGRRLPPVPSINPNWSFVWSNR